jgi:hypothetical protein
MKSLDCVYKRRPIVLAAEVLANLEDVVWTQANKAAVERRVVQRAE